MMNLTIGRKLAIGFGVVILLLVAMYITSERMAASANHAAVEADQMGDLAHAMSDRITDHYKWLDGLNRTFVKNGDGVHVQLDPTKCALGKWLGGKDAAALKATDPEAAKLIEAAKIPHVHLHTSAQKIDKLWQQRHEGLAEALWNALGAHATWSQKVSNAILSHDKTLDVQKEATKCGYGQFLQSQACADAMAQSPKLRELLDGTKEAHRRLHASAGDIDQALKAGAFEEAAKLYNEITLPALDIIGHGLHAAIHLEQEASNAQAQARDILETETAPALKGTQKALENLGAHLGHRSDQAGANQAGAMTLMHRANLLITVVAVVLAIMAGLIISRAITKPIKAMVNRLKDIAEGEGDLTQRVDETRKDELGELGKWFNAFVQKVHDVVFEVAGVTREVAGAATQIAASSEEMAQGMQQQTQQTTQVSSAVEEMSSTVVEVARKSSDAATSADAAGQQANDGGQVVQQTVDGMKTIADVVNESAGAINELGKRGEQIGQIIGVINDIADQTNLLALNAAIEAARAGEHGRGFAVVADEVRKLAERTTQATEEVGESIKAIQTETSTAVERMSAGTETVGEGVKLAERAGDSLSAIVDGSDRVANMIQSIAAAAEEQSAASEEIARNVENINAVTKQSAEGAGQAAQAATQLSSKAEQLQQLVAQFKLANS